MKQLISFSPTFTPGNAGQGTLDFSAYPGFALDKLYAVINVTQNSPLFIPGTPQYGFAGVSNSPSVILLSANTSTFSTSDTLSVFYDSSSYQDVNSALERGGNLQAVQEVTNQILVELKVMNNVLLQGFTLNNMNDDSLQSMRDDINNSNNLPSNL